MPIAVMPGRRWGSLRRAWWRVHWRAMAVRSALLVASDCANFLTPLLLQALLSCLEAGDSTGKARKLQGSPLSPLPPLKCEIEP